MPLDGILGTRGGWLFNRNLKPRLSVILSYAVILLVWALAIVGASIHDNSLHLPPPGRGLLDHYGFQATFVVAPLMLGTCYFAISHFLCLLRNLDDVLVAGADPSTVRAIIKPHIESLFLRSDWRYLLVLMMIIGLGGSIWIFRKLDVPQNFWGNDVFNAMSYRYSFIAANLYLAVVWSVICPVVIFYVLHITASTEIIVARLRRRNLFRLNFLHIDNCGGMSGFGKLNFLIMLIYVWPFGAFYALSITHRYTYLSLIIGVIIVSALLIGQSIYGIYSVSKTITSEREQFVALLNQRIAKAMEGTRKNFTSAVAEMQYRDRVLAVTPFPYSKRIAAAVNVLRFAPAGIAIANFFHQIA
jgi:hypothetical protein